MIPIRVQTTYRNLMGCAGRVTSDCVCDVFIFIGVVALSPIARMERQG